MGTRFVSRFPAHYTLDQVTFLSGSDRLSLSLLFELTRYFRASRSRGPSLSLSGLSIRTPPTSSSDFLALSLNSLRADSRSLSVWNSPELPAPLNFSLTLPAALSVGCGGSLDAAADAGVVVIVVDVEVVSEVVVFKEVVFVIVKDPTDLPSLSF